MIVVEVLDERIAWLCICTVLIADTGLAQIFERTKNIE